MGRKLRIALYILSLSAAAAVFFMMISGASDEGKQSQTVAEKETEKAGLMPETEVYEETAENSQADMNENTEKDTAVIAEATEEATERTIEDTTIIFTGDVLFGGSFTSNYDSSGIEGVISHELLEELNDADILMINNEFPFSDRGTPMEGKQYTFECSPSYAVALNEMGVDVASLANNHTLDYGTEALSDTFKALDDAGVLYAGAGETVERAEEVQVIEVNGKKFGFLAVSRVIPVAEWKVEFRTPGLFSCYDDTRLLELIKEAKKTCDYLAVYPHWGVEYDAYPQDYQTKIAKDCIEAGADVVVGSHTHCLQGAAWIDGKPVVYSLGNFMFGREIERSAILKVTVAQDGEATYTYIPVYAENGCTKIATSDAAGEILSYIDAISDAKVSDDGVISQRGN